jgi:hypothetical protein
MPVACCAMLRVAIMQRARRIEHRLGADLTSIDPHVVTLVSINPVGDRLRDVLDPRLASHYGA